MALGLFGTLPGMLVFSNGSGLTATQVGYGDSANKIAGDSAFVRTSLALSIDASTDNTFTTGYGKMGLATSGTSTVFYLANGAAFTSAAYALRQTAGGVTTLNSITGSTLSLAIANTAKVSLTASSCTFASGVPVTISDSTAATSTSSGALIVAGGGGFGAATFGTSWTGSGNITSTGGRVRNSAGATTAEVTGVCSFWRSGGTIGTAGDMVFQSDLGVTNAAFVFRAGQTTPITVATLSGAAVAGTTPGFTTVGTSTITGGVTDGYNGAYRLTPTYDAATALTVTRHNYLDVNDVAVTGAGPAAVTDACVLRFNAAIGTHKAVDSGTTKTSPGTVTCWVKVNVNGTVHYMPAYSSKTS